MGVAAIKESIELIEEQFATSEDEIVLVADPQGVVFVSSRQEWLYHTMAKLSSEVMLNLTKSQQFRDGPWQWTGLAINGNKAVDGSGKTYLLMQIEVDN